GDAGVVLRDSHVVASGRRPVWRAGLLRAAAAPRNWHSHGDWRAAGSHRSISHREYLDHGVGGSAGGPGAWSRFGALHRVTALSGEGHRFGALDASGVGHLCGGASGRTAGGDPRGAHRSSYGAAFGIRKAGYVMVVTHRKCT